MCPIPVCETRAVGLDQGLGKNDTSTEEVKSVFLEAVGVLEESDYTVGGEEEGLWTGTLFLDALSENGAELLALTVSLAPEVSWRQSKLWCRCEGGL